MGLISSWLELGRMKFLLSEVTRLSDNVRRTYNCTYFVLFPWQVFSFQQMYTFRTCFETVRIPYMFEVVRVVYIFDIVPCAALLRSSFHRTSMLANLWRIRMRSVHVFQDDVLHTHWSDPMEL